MRTLFPILGLLAIALPGCAPAQTNDIVAFPGTELPTQDASAGYTLEAPIQIIAADPKGQAVINKHIPKLLGNPNYELFKGMSLKTIAMFSGGDLSDEKLALVKADLGALSLGDK